MHNRITTVDDKLQQSLLQAQENIASLLKIKANQDKFENDIIDLNLEIGLTKENVREVKQDVEDVQSKLLKMDIEMTEVSDKQKRMQDVIDKQTITINGMGGSKLSTIMPNSKWSLADLIDADSFPLLKATMEKTDHYSQFYKGLEKITLKDDNILSIENFWESINIAMMSALNSNKTIGRFEDLTESTKLIDELLPQKAILITSKLSTHIVLMRDASRHF